MAEEASKRVKVANKRSSGKLRQINSACDMAKKYLLQEPKQEIVLEKKNEDESRSLASADELSQYLETESVTSYQPQSHLVLRPQATTLSTGYV